MDRTFFNKKKKLVSVIDRKKKETKILPARLRPATSSSSSIQTCDEIIRKTKAKQNKIRYKKTLNKFVNNKSNKIGKIQQKSKQNEINVNFFVSV